MINTIIIKDYFRRHYLIIPLAVFWVFFWFYVEEIGVEEALYGHAFWMNVMGPIVLYRSRAEVKALVMLPESPRRLSLTLFFMALLIMPLIDLACLVVGSLIAKLFTDFWPFPLIHLPLVFLAGITWGGTWLWLFLEDTAAMARKGKGMGPANLTGALLIITIWLLQLTIIVPMEVGLSLLALGLVLTYQAWRKVPILYGPPSVQPTQVKPQRLKHKALKPFSPSLGSFLFGAMLSAVFAAVTLWGVWQQDFQIENAGETFTANHGMLLMIAPVLSIGIVWRWGSAIRALRALPLSSWGIVLIYIRILFATILGLLIWMGMAAVVFQNFMAIRYLLLYSLLIFFAGILLCSLHLRWQLKGTLAGVLFFQSWVFVTIAQVAFSPHSSSGEFFLKTKLFTIAPLLLILIALSCYWLYRLIAYNSSVYRCAVDGNTRL